MKKTLFERYPFLLNRNRVPFSPLNMPSLVSWYDPLVRYSWTSATETTTVTNGSAWGRTNDRNNSGKNLIFNTATSVWSQENDQTGSITFAAGKYARAGAPTDWPFLFDGTGGTVIIFCNQTSAGDVMGQGPATANHYGFNAYNFNPSGALLQPQVLLGNGTGTLAVLMQSAASSQTHTTNQVNALCYRAKSGGTYGDVTYSISGSQVMKLNAGTVTFAAGTPQTPLQIGRLGVSAFPGKVYGVMVFNKELTVDEEFQVLDYFRRKKLAFSDRRIAFLGDSNTNGSWLSSTFPARVVSALGSRYLGTNYGISGNCLDSGSDAVNNFRDSQWRGIIRPTNSPTNTLVGSVANRAHNIFVIQGGVNDLKTTSRTGPQIHNGFLSLKTEIQAWMPQAKVVLCTTLPCKSYLNDPTKESELDNLLHLQRGMAAFNNSYFQVVDTNASALNDGNGSLAAAYNNNADLVHVNDAGAAIWSELVVNAIRHMD